MHTFKEFMESQRGVPNMGNYTPPDPFTSKSYEEEMAVWKLRCLKGFYNIVANIAKTPNPKAGPFVYSSDGRYWVYATTLHDGKISPTMKWDVRIIEMLVHANIISRDTNKTPVVDSRTQIPYPPGTLCLINQQNLYQQLQQLSTKHNIESDWERFGDEVMHRATHGSVRAVPGSSVMGGGH
jgi:hypothetical protein